MNNFYLLLSWILVCGLACSERMENQNSEEMTKDRAGAEYAIVIHGGAGTFQRAKDETGLKERYIRAMKQALDSGRNILTEGGTSLDAVESVIRILEDDSLFNAGKGAVLTHDNTFALDASIMEGKQLKAGAVGGIGTIKHPITAARAVMEHSPHVLLAGKGAEAFAELRGLETVSPDYFRTLRSERYLERVKAREKGMGQSGATSPEEQLGTVGAVALDRYGTIAAGTSTGGMTNKKWGRIGDSPIIGAGTYADNRTCGVSCTGHGEYFIRYVLAHDLSARMKYGEKTLDEAAKEIIHGTLKPAGGSGGLIALDRKGNISMPFNTSAMLRAYAKSDGSSEIKIFQEQ